MTIEIKTATLEPVRNTYANVERRFGDKPWPACRFDVCAIDDERIDWLRDAFR